MFFNYIKIPVVETYFPLSALSALFSVHFHRVREMVMYIYVKGVQKIALTALTNPVCRGRITKSV